MSERAAIALVIFAVCFIAASPHLMEAHEERALLVRLEPVTMALHAILLVIALAASARAICRTLRPDAGIVIVGCACALLGLTAVLMLAPPGHRLYFDEDIYTQVGHGIAWDGRAGMVEVSVPDAGDPRGWRGVTYSLNKEPSGFPFLIAIASRLRFTGESAGRAASLACFAFGIMGMGILASRTFPSFSPGGGLVAGFASAAFALWPENLRWAGTSAAEPAAAGTAIGALLLAELSSKCASRPLRFAAVLALTFAAQQRPEGFLLIVPFVLLVGVRSFFRDRVAIAMLVVTLVVPFLHLIAVSGEDWGASGPRFSLAYVASNLRDNVTYWFRTDIPGNVFPPPRVFAPLAALGFAVWLRLAVRGVDESRAPRALLAWVVLFIGIFIPFYAGSYRYGVDVRFSLLVVAPYLLAVATGAVLVGGWVSRARFLTQLTRIQGSSPAFIAAILIFLPLILALPDVARATPEAKLARADHAAVAVFARDLPRDAVVVSHSPSVWMNRGIAAVQLARAAMRPAVVDRLFDAYTVYYYIDYWDIAGTGREIPGEPTPSELWRALYDSDEVGRIEDSDGHTFRLLKMRRRAG